MPEPLTLTVDLSRMAQAASAAGLDPSPSHQIPPDPSLGSGTSSDWLGIQEAVQFQFRTLESRTAEAMRIVLDETVKAGIAVNLLADELFSDAHPTTIPASVEDSYRNDFAKFVSRLSGYKAALDKLAPTSTDTGAIYVGLIVRKPGAGHVPDVVMPQSLANQLGILEEHTQDLVTRHGSRLLQLLFDVGKKETELIDGVKDLPKEATDEFDKAAAKVSDTIVTAAKVLFGVLVVAIVGAGVAVGVGVSRRRRELERS